MPTPGVWCLVLQLTDTISHRWRPSTGTAPESRPLRPSQALFRTCTRTTSPVWPHFSERMSPSTEDRPRQLDPCAVSTCAAHVTPWSYMCEALELDNLLPTDDACRLCPTNTESDSAVEEHTSPCPSPRRLVQRTGRHSSPPVVDTGTISFLTDLRDALDSITFTRPNPLSADGAADQSMKSVRDQPPPAQM